LEKILTRIFLLVIVILCINYGFIIFIPFILGLYFLFDKSWWNLLVLAGYFIIFFLLASNVSFLIYSTIILLVIVILTNYFSKDTKEDSGDMDFSKLFGNMG
jgi:glucose-6-phosphate-specific signal transduction histidine kinase